ncbi:hypothetical protein QAD02_019945 [Eretmocerus hayati]|uniref:Uncharacterized protein n=1 Tax=Eretmocerus hayati TaxID=131215 RepID=A0ACC2PM36_9HYME|nr:hypothetical protein QAD02_019945 [Eretmocerus hayati]
MRGISSTFLVTIFIIVSLTSCKTSKICAVRGKDSQSSSGSLDSASDVEDAFNTNNENQTQAEVTFERCDEYCYTYWQEEESQNGTRINIFLQGCWKDDGQECANSECVANKWTKSLNNKKFCCCREDYCNVNVTDPFGNRLLLTSPASKSSSRVIFQATEYLDSEDWVPIIMIILACILLVVFSALILIYQIYKNNLNGLGKPLPFNENYPESNGLRTGTYTFDHLKLSNIIGEGRYGSVWQGGLGDQDVAVKIFPGVYQSHFLNERDVYCLPFMEHPSLLQYYGSDERMSMDGNNEYILVFSYAPGGTLTDFLRYHTIDWMTFCKMGLSIVKGLAFLHTDIRRGDKFKPCVAHRDMNTKNILIKADGSCCICDLGLAVQISGSKYYSNGEEQHAETKSINDVGTLQYMAPEVLEGAVNLRDCESSLKQIDVYAMGLILWEILSRCADIYIPGTEIPPYRLPFEKEIGLHPTFEQMQVLVSRNKARPLLEPNLVDKPGVRLIRETIEDCWDSDAEARLTALCIEERLTELRSRRVTMYFMDGSPMVNSQCGFVPSTTNSLFSDSTHHNGAHVVQLFCPDGSEAAVDSFISPLPSEGSAPEYCAKNSNEVASMSLAMQQNQQLQPYQGRNPCMERNLMMQSNSCEEIECHGNILVDKSSKHLSGIDSHSQYAKLLPNSETQSLMPHDYLGHQYQQQSHHVTSSQALSLRSNTPIPYVQNVISECSGGSSSYFKLKQTNIQESSYSAQPTGESPCKRRFSGWTNLKKILANKKMMYQHCQPAYTKCQIERDDSKSNLLTNRNCNKQPKIVETNVSISPTGKYVNGIVGDQVKKSHTTNSTSRPSSLTLLNSTNGKSETNLSRQESLDRFNEVFNRGSNSSISLKDPHMRIKTPGDLPPSVRKVRGRNGQSAAARFSLYDDRIMCNISNENESAAGSTDNIGLSSSSVPFGMDFADEQLTLPVNVDASNVTCF